MGTEQERFEARIMLATAISDAVKAAMAASPTPELVFLAAPVVMAGLAGAQISVLIQSGIMGDGEAENVLSMAMTSMRDLANPRNGEPDPLCEQVRGAIRP